MPLNSNVMSFSKLLSELYNSFLNIFNSYMSKLLITRDAKAYFSRTGFDNSHIQGNFALNINNKIRKLSFQFESVI